MVVVCWFATFIPPVLPPISILKSPSHSYLNPVIAIHLNPYRGFGFANIQP